jgi:hypothetical protein
MMQPILSWALLPSKVFSLFASKSAFTLFSSFALHEELFQGKLPTLYHRVSKNEESGLSPRRLPTFLGFLPSSIFMVFRRSSSPGLWIHLEIRGTSPPSDHLSSGQSPTDRSKQ